MDNVEFLMQLLGKSKNSQSDQNVTGKSCDINQKDGVSTKINAAKTLPTQSKIKFNQATTDFSQNNNNFKKINNKTTNNDISEIFRPSGALKDSANNNYKLKIIIIIITISKLHYYF